MDKPAPTGPYPRVGWTLLGGLLVSIAVMVLGLILVALSGASTTHVLPLGQVGPRLIAGDSAAVLDLGILMLFATPLAAVVVALGEFMRERDIPFVLVTGCVLVMLGIAFGVALR